jgi:hypothetical protein
LTAACADDHRHARRAGYRWPRGKFKLGHIDQVVRPRFAKSGQRPLRPRNLEESAPAKMAADPVVMLIAQGEVGTHVEPRSVLLLGDTRRQMPPY